jgi:hypothetical protein
VRRAPGSPGVIDEYLFSTREPWRIYFNTANWKRIVNGSPGYIPDSYKKVAVVTADFPSDASIDFLRRAGVQYVIMEGERYKDHVRALALYRPKRDRHFKLVKKSGKTCVFRIT